MEAYPSLCAHRTAIGQNLRKWHSRITATSLPVLAISLITVALAVLTSCSMMAPHEADVLVIPLRMGLARDNGATPWYGELTIGDASAADADAGSSGQLFKFIMDTGTSSTWVTSRECDTVPCRHHRRYDRRGSASYVSIDQEAQSSELGPWGKFQFKVGQDAWHFWAINPRQSEQDKRLYSVQGMKFLEAVTLIDGQEPDGTANTNWDDLVQDGSLAFPSQDAGSPSTQLLDLLLQDGLVDRKVMSYWTNPELNRGEVVLGGLNETRFEPESLRTYPVGRGITAVDNASDLWSVALAGIRVGGTEVMMPPEGAAFVLDTGSSRFKGDPAIVERIVKLITDNGTRPQIVKNPAALDAYPDLTLVLVDKDGGRNEYTLSALEYSQAFPDGWHLAFHGLQPTENSSTTGLLLAGSVFLDHYYAVFDYETDPVQVGIADRVDP